MERNLLKYGWLAAAILLLASGVLALVFAGSTFETAAAVIGVLMIASAALQLGARWMLRDTVFYGQSFFTGALMTLIVGVFMLGNSFIAAEVLRFLTGMWLLAAGISHVGSAMELKRARVWGWGWLLAIALAAIGLGILTFLKPVVLNVAAGVVVSVCLLYEGASMLYVWYVGMRFKKFLKG